MVIGGGVAGIQAALDCAEGGLEVVLVERESTIGGKMAKLDKTFPTVDCSSCILGPKMVDVAQHPNIKLLAYSEVDQVNGYVGNFQVEVRRKATYVDWTKCTGCGACMEKCPSKKVPDRFNERIGLTTAINIPFPQAIPKKAVIDPAYCRQFIKGKCGVCAKVCPSGAIDYSMTDEVVTEEVGAIVAATGYDLFDISKCDEYGGGRYPGRDHRAAVRAAALGLRTHRRAHQAPLRRRRTQNHRLRAMRGVRDKSQDRPYCSGFCCMYTAKQAILTKDHIPDSRVLCLLHGHPRTGEALRRVHTPGQEEYGAQYIRGRVAMIYPKGDKYVVRGADTLLGAQVEIEADLVVLAAGAESAAGAAVPGGKAPYFLRQLRLFHGKPSQASAR